MATNLLDDFGVRDEVIRMAENDPAALTQWLYTLADDLKGAKYRKAGPYARAAREAGFALADTALRYGREADALAELRAEAA